MASPASSFTAAKPSFAKVAAMAIPSPKPRTSNVAPKPISGLRGGPALPASSTRTTSITPTVSTVLADTAANSGEVPQGDRKLEHVLAELDLRTQVSGTQDAAQIPSPSGQKSQVQGEDDQSHLSGSSSKPLSFETKSNASVTTFQMDEKESLRPDDSASVQAAEEDESAVNSRVGSELGPSASRDQPREMLRRGPVILPNNAPRFGESNLNVSPGVQQNPALRQMSFTSGERLQGVENQPAPALPDEKLLEAMNTPKDRLALLQMEERILFFIQQSKDDFFELPPQNSFGRLLAHKLADYYSLQHLPSNDSNIVRIFRTGSALPPSLISLTSTLPQNGLPPSATAAFKIMRRGGHGSGKTSATAGTPASSTAVSKATSETGGDTSDDGAPSPFDPSVTKEKAKMTREEREAQYEAARKRIFADVPESADKVNEGESSASMSRSSSTSGRRKGHKQRAPKDDSFEARSQFNAYYPGIPYTNNQSLPGPQQNMPYSLPNMISPPQSNGPSPGYASPAQSFTPYEQQQQYGQIPQYNMGSNQYAPNGGWPMMQTEQNAAFYPYDQSNQPGSSILQQPANMSSPSMSQYAQPMQQYQPSGTTWGQVPYSNTFPQNSMSANASPVHWPSYPSQQSVQNSLVNNSPYQYGQYPPTYGANTPNQQHLGGTYGRPGFNPQTRSFVPNNMSARFPMQQSPQPSSFVSQPKMNKVSGYMGNDPVASPPTFSPRPTAPSSLPRGQTQHQTTPNTSPLAALNRQDSIQKKWGTPAHLPKKPPPSEVPSSFDRENAPTLPSQQNYIATNNGTIKNGTPLIMQSGSTAPSQGYNTKILAGGS